ncbi:hypothetical protein TELCIR_02291, partial [Teladorsagia circumcincta]
RSRRRVSEKETEIVTKRVTEKVITTDECRTASSPSSKVTSTPKEELPPSMGTPHKSSEKTTEIVKKSSVEKSSSTEIDQIKKGEQSPVKEYSAKSPQPSDGWDDVLAQAPPLNECGSEPQHGSPHRYRFVVPMVVLADIKGKIYRLTTHYTVTITSCSTGQGTFTESSPIDVEKKKGHKQ